MTRKRMIKLLMGLGCERNTAARAAAMADGSLFHAVLYYDLCEKFAKALRQMQQRYIIEGDHTGAVAGMVGSVYD